MRNFKAAGQQQGAVLVIALVMLLVLTILAVSNMRGVVLESRITASRGETQRLQDVADAALREAEFRISGPNNLRDKLEFNEDNCKETNVLKTNHLNKPCLLKEIADQSKLKQLFDNPIAYLGKAGNDGTTSWMLYRGLDAKESNYYKPDSNRKSFWNTYVAASASVEFGDVLEGRGTYYYLVNGQARDALTVQSTTANIFPGLND